MNTENSNAQIQILLTVDRHFPRYELEFLPQNAAEAAESLGRPDIASFVRTANRILVMCRGYSVRIGRQYGERIVAIDVFKGSGINLDDFIDRIEPEAFAAGGKCRSEEGPDGLELRIRWE